MFIAPQNNRNRADQKAKQTHVHPFSERWNLRRSRSSVSLREPEFSHRIFNQISFTMSTNSSPSNPADATTTSVIINSKIVAFTAMMFFKMTFIQIKIERSAENEPSSSKILRKIKIARILSRGFTDARNGWEGSSEILPGKEEA